MTQPTQTQATKKRPFSEGPFSKEIQKYEELIDKETGMKKLFATTKENFYNRIQEQVEDQLLDTIIKRYKVDLNDKHITEIQEDLVDMTQYPEDLLSAYALAHQLEQQFLKSPAEVKAKFGDFAGYLKAFQNGTLANDLSSVLSKQPSRDKTVSTQLLNQVTPVQQPVQQNAAVNTPQNTSVIQPQVNNGVIAGQQTIGGVRYE